LRICVKLVSGNEVVKPAERTPGIARIFRNTWS
jgi:hypothetical protein